MSSLSVGYSRRTPVLSGPSQKILASPLTLHTRWNLVLLAVAVEAAEGVFRLDFPLLLDIDIICHIFLEDTCCQTSLYYIGSRRMSISSG